MNFYSTLLIFFATTLFINAQNDYQPGYIVSYTNDTTRGLIEYGFSQNANFNKCKFKLNDSVNPTTYLAGEIMEYMLLNQKLYTSKNIPIGDSTELVFVEVLVKGAVNLYYYIDKIDPVYFIEKDNGEIYQLENRLKTGVINNHNYEIDANKHIGILHYALSDCPEINQQIDITQLSHNSLIKLAKDYHEYTCTTGKECVVYKKPKKTSWSFGIYAGYLNSHLKVNPSSYPYAHYIPEYFISTSFDVGGLIVLNPLGKTNKFSFILFSGISSLSFNEENPPADKAIDENYKKHMNINYWHNTISVKYTYPGKIIKPYAHAGIKSGLTLLNNYDLFGAYDTWGNWVSKFNRKAPVTPLFYGFQVGGGLDFFLLSKLIVFIDAAYSYEFSTYNRITNLHIKSGIRF